MEARYEDTVADLEKEGSRVTKFLGLEWHEKQARFFEHNQEKPIFSNNAPDVVQAGLQAGRRTLASLRETACAGIADAGAVLPEVWL